MSNTVKRSVPPIGYPSAIPIRPDVLAPGGGSGDNGDMQYVPRPELDAKLETIETRMDGRIARIEDRFTGIDERFNRIDSTIADLRTEMRTFMQSTKNAVWYAAATVIATFIAIVTVNITAFDSGRDTAKIAADAQQQTAAALSEIRQIVADMRTQNAVPPVQPSE